MPVKNLPSKKAKKEVVTDNENEENDILSPSTPKNVKEPIEIDEVEVPVEGDEKVEEDPLISSEEDDDFADDMGIGDEIDPFGDKWEA